MTDNNDPVPDADNEALRALYRSGPQARVPPRLDQSVMGIASKEARGNTALRWFLPWRRPAVFIVTAGLSLAIVIEMSEMAVFERSPLAAGDTQQEFATEAVESLARMRQLGETARHLALGEDSAVSQFTIKTQEATFCNDDQIETPESWLKCIAQLRTRGFQADADAETSRLLSAHPDFTLAE